MKSIETKYLPCTNFRGSRIKAFAEGGNRITLSYDSGLSQDENHAAAAIALARKLNWKGELIIGHTEKGCVFNWASDQRYAIG